LPGSGEGQADWVFRRDDGICFCFGMKDAKDAQSVEEVGSKKCLIAKKAKQNPFL